MRSHPIIFVILAIVAAACVLPQTTVPPTSIRILAASETVAPSATAKPTSTPPPSEVPPTSTPSQTQTATTEPGPAPIHPTVVKLCPSTPMVPLSNLGLDSQTRLLMLPFAVETVWDEIGSGLYVVSRDLPIPQRVNNLSKGGQVNSTFYNVSPNGQWIIFDRKTISTSTTRAWISSIDGTQQWLLSPLDELGFGRWLDDKTIVLKELSGQPRKVINPFTMEAELLPDLPPTQIDGIGAILFRDAGHTLMLYQAGHDYRLFDTAMRTDQQVLLWLSAVAIPFDDKSIGVTTNGRIVISTIRTYGFDMSRQLQVSEMLASESYTQTMQPVILPGEILPDQDNGLRLPLACRSSGPQG